MLALREVLIPEAHVLLVLATIVVAGISAGTLARRLRLPGVTGQILVGVLLGQAGLEVYGDEVVAELQPLKEFALGLMGVTVGAHLSFRRLRNAGKRLLWLLLAESAVTPVLVFLAMFAAGIDTSLALLLAALAVSTAPATVVAMVKETRSRGVFVKTLVAAVALNNMTCIFLFEMSHTLVSSTLAEEEMGMSEALSAGLAQLLGALVLGAACGAALILLTEHAQREERVATTATLGLLFTYGLAQYLGLSPLLACLFLGLVQANFTPDRDRILDAAFSSFEPIILAVFFVLAGMHLSFDDLLVGGPVALLFCAARAAGKLSSAHLAMRLAGATERVQRWLGMALVPQAGLAIGLVVLVENDPSFQVPHAQELLSLFLAVVLAAVTINEIVGPILARIALRRSGEAGRDRMRLIDFLQEENIVTGVKGETKEEVIGRLTDLLVSSHHLVGVNRDAILASVLDREQQISTCLGGGLFIPHGSLPAGRHGMLGVMGLSQEGLGFATPDGVPVHCIVLLLTPENERERHLQVLALLARVVGTDPVFRERLFEANTPAHVYELLHGEETEHFNYYLDSD